MSTTAVEPLTTQTVLDRVGGVRGMIDGGLPPLVFVVLNTAARAAMAPAEAVRLALAGALVTGAVIIAVRRTQHRTLVQAMRGLAGLAVAALFAVFSGQARDFFLPGIVVDTAYAVGFAVSVLVGRPLVGAVYRLLSGRRIPWHDDPAMRRVFAVATLGWSMVYTARAGVQIAFYRDDHPTLLAVSKLVLGWPLTALAVVLTLAYLRRSLVTSGAVGARAAEVGRADPGASAAPASATARPGGSRVPQAPASDILGSMHTERRPDGSRPEARDVGGRGHRAPGGGGEHDVVVVGAGQAGLATAYHLRDAGVDVLLLERAGRVGTSWSRRWDSLRLFTPARYDALPGLPFPGAPWSYPGKDDVADYLAAYVAHFDLPVRTGADVVALTGHEGAFRLHLADGETIRARRVVVATGAFGRPYTPAPASRLGAEVVQVHTDDYRNPALLPSGPVLVVGGGNSGFQVAQELAMTGRPVHLAEGARLRTVPQRIAGRDLFWWLTTTGVIHAPGSSRLGRRLRADEPIIGTSRRSLRRAGVTFHPRVVDATGTTVTFRDGASLSPSAVVWATGYRHDDRWIAIDGALDPAGALASDGADTAVPGLHTIGRPWQRDRGSALLGYVHRDAERLAGRLSGGAPVRPAMTHRRSESHVASS